MFVLFWCKAVNKIIVPLRFPPTISSKSTVHFSHTKRQCESEREILSQMTQCLLCADNDNDDDEHHLAGICHLVALH